jgi:hypothetical protein
VDEEEMEEVSIDLLSSSDEKSISGGEDVDNGDMQDGCARAKCNNTCGEVIGLF